jgi:periplasmic protein TonB
MSTSVFTEVPAEPVVSQAKPSRFKPNLKARGTYEPGEPASYRAKPVELTFRSSMLECNRMARRSRPFDFLVALLVNTSLLVAPVFAGLYFTDTINLKQFETTFLIAPPPPPPPPAPVATVAPARQVHRVFQQAGKLVAPTAVPREIAVIKEAPIPESEFGGGIAGGVPGGVPGGSMGGVIGGLIGGASSAVPKAPLAPSEIKPKAPVRVGGSVRSPKVIVRVEPEYPVLARQTHVQGVVVIDAVLDEKGNVADMKIVSGPQLLYKAALDALAKWRYEPTYLNDQPVAVELLVTITFRLNQE